MANEVRIERLIPAAAAPGLVKALKTEFGEKCTGFLTDLSSTRVTFEDTPSAEEKSRAVNIVMQYNIDTRTDEQVERQRELEAQLARIERLRDAENAKNTMDDILGWIQYQIRYEKTPK